MGEYVRSYPEAPTQEEIEQGYAPSTISGKPFAKFLFWIFAGLGVTYALAYGVIRALDLIEQTQASRYERMAARQPAEFTGPPLQPSPGHETLDTQDMAEMHEIWREQLRGMQLWKDDTQNRGAFGRAAIGDQVLANAQTAIADWSAKAGQGGGKKSVPEQNLGSAEGSSGPSQETQVERPPAE